jgi:hypothetical protein
MNQLHVAAICGLTGLPADWQAGFQADDAPRHSGPDFGKASPFGLLVVVLLLIGVMFLVRSMNRHLRNLPDSFDTQNPAPDQAPYQAAADGTIGTDEPMPRHPDGRLPDEPDG